MHHDVAAIVLAAGRGTRMGGPKALLVVDGEPLVLAQARRLATVAHEVVVVLPPDLDVAALAWPPGLRIVRSAAAEPAGSLALGAAALGPAARRVLVALVDALPARKPTLAALLAAATGGVLAATPTHHGRGGHPVVVHRSVLDAEASAPLRDRLRALGERRVRVSCDDDPAVVTSLKTPRDVQALRAVGAAVHIAFS
jgi:molybdenum cofactor cytidylyltransferase